METKKRTARTLVDRLSSASEHTRTAALCELRLLSKHDPDFRPIIAASGALPCLTDFLYSTTSTTTQENASATLLNLSISSPHLLMSSPNLLLDSLSHLLLHHHLPTTSPSAVQSSAATLYSLLVSSDHYRSTIGSKRDILFALIDIIRTPTSPSRSIKEALKALFGISLCAENRPAMVEMRVVGALFGVVMRGGRGGVVEDATAVVAQVAGCNESVEEFGKVGGVELLVDLVDEGTGGSGRVRENSVAALLNLVKCGGGEVVEEEVRTGCLRVLDGVMEVAENGSSEKAKRKARDLLGLICNGGDDGREGSGGHLRFDFVLNGD